MNIYHKIKPYIKTFQLTFFKKNIFSDLCAECQTDKRDPSEPLDSWYIDNKCQSDNWLFLFKLVGTITFGITIFLGVTFVGFPQVPGVYSRI